MGKKFVFVAGIILALVVSLVAPVAVAAQPSNTVKVFVAFDRQPGADEEAIVRGAGGNVKYTYHLVPAIAASVPETAIQGLLRNPRVTRIEPVIDVYAVDAELDTSWGVKRIGAGTVHTYNKGTGIKVAIIDSGIDWNHPDLDANYAGGYDFVNNDNNPMDDNGHGTHVAGVIAAEDNDSGVVGVAPQASIYALKVLGANGSGSYDDVVAAIEWAVSNGIQVTNNSYGSSGDPGVTVKEAFDNAYAAGVLHVAAAGNSGTRMGTGDNVIYPARWESVIAVAATDKSDARASWSSTGPAVELAAPGVSVYSTYWNDTYATLSGTSMASPHVAGTAALVMVAYPGWTNVEVRSQLRSTADDLGEGGPDTKYGYGLVDADGAAPNTTPSEPTHDVAITSISVPSAVGRGDVVQVGVTVANEGTYEETTTIGLIDTTDDIAIGSQTLTLTAGTASTLTFSWNTASSSLGTHVLKAEASVVPDETDTADNIKTATVSVVEKKALYVDVTTNKTTYKLGETVSIIVRVNENDATGPTVQGASVHIEVTTASGRKYAADGTTDSEGKVVFSLKTKVPDGRGTYSVVASASKEGYDSGSDTTTFVVQ